MMKTSLVLVSTLTAVISGTAFLLVFNPAHSQYRSVLAQHSGSSPKAGTMARFEAELLRLYRRINIRHAADRRESSSPENTEFLHEAVIRQPLDPMSRNLAFVVPTETTANAGARKRTLRVDYFSSETGDSLWASRTESQLIHQFDRLNAEGNFLLNAECQSDFCRIEVYHEDKAAEQSFLSAFAQPKNLADDDKYGFYRTFTDGNGNRRTLFLYARKGYFLPEEKWQ